MPATPTSLLFRDAKADDADLNFIVSAFDSTIPHLADIGCAGQWGTVPWSDRPGFKDDTLKELRQSEHYLQTGEGDPLRIFIAETEVHEQEFNRSTRIPVALAMVTEDLFAEHLKSRENLEADITAAETRSFLYLKVVLTDFRQHAAKYRTRAGAEMMKYVQQFAQERGKEALYLDCWSGNNGGLNKLV